MEQTMATATKQPPVENANASSVRVEIFDQGYNLRGTDPEYIIKLAEYVDSKMRAVAEQTHTVDSSRLAVLAALNIADEYHLLKRKADGGTSDSSRRTRQLLNALDEVLRENRRSG
jgi:cell division protein ZapA